MREFKIGLKKYQEIELIDETTCLVERKGKKFLMRDLRGNMKEYYRISDSYKKFSNTGIKHPKVRANDKKNGLLIIDYIEGETALDLLIKDDLPEVIYEKIFYLAYMAKIEHKALNFDPSLYKFDGKELYYLSEDLYPFNDDTKFINKGIRLWFYTKEFVELLNEKGLKGDPKRIKEDYAVNKQIVLMTCKYYH